MADEPSAVKHCPHCGEAVAEAQGVCPNCGALLHGVWPPPPEHEQRQHPVPPAARLLTGRGWLDSLLGYGAWWLLLWGLERFSTFVINASLIYNMRRGWSQPPPPDYWLWAAIAVPALTVYVGAYFGMRLLSPKMAREFGQMALWGLCSIPLLLLLYWLVR